MSVPGFFTIKRRSEAEETGGKCDHGFITLGGMRPIYGVMWYLLSRLSSPLSLSGFNSLS
jgi:hypothetical protein